MNAPLRPRSHVARNHGILLQDGLTIANRHGREDRVVARRARRVAGGVDARHAVKRQALRTGRAAEKVEVAVSSAGAKVLAARMVEIVGKWEGVEKCEAAPAVQGAARCRAGEAVPRLANPAVAIPVVETPVVETPVVVDRDLVGDRRVTARDVAGRSLQGAIR